MKNSQSTFGKLYIVATPIGNLADLSQRAIDTLKNVDMILAEDTRHSRPLLNSLGIKKKLIALHDHNETELSPNLIASFKQGLSMALISDAGTPLISDPGFFLVRLAREEGIQIVPIPGPSALITALCAAGLPCDSFFFTGFLPAKPLARKEKLVELQHLTSTLIAYESTHRILDCLDSIIEVYGKDYELVLAKELTKQFETILHATASTLKKWLLEEEARCKGEFVLILPAVEKNLETQEDERILRLLLNELPLKQAVKLTATIINKPKNDLYKLALELEKK